MIVAARNRFTVAARFKRSDYITPVQYIYREVNKTFLVLVLTYS